MLAWGSLDAWRSGSDVVRSMDSLSELSTLTRHLQSEVGAQEPLPPEEEARLARLVREGKTALQRLRDSEPPTEERRRLEAAAEEGRDALGTLLAHNLPLVIGMTRRYRWSGVSLLDLFQEGVLGLLRAAENFDWTRGTPFGAYASWWVRHAMSRAVRSATSSVSLPDDKRIALGRLATARNVDPSATWEELAQRAGVDPEDAEHLVPLLGSPISLDAVVGADADTPLGDLLADRAAEEAMEEVLVRAEVDRLLRIADRELTDRERRIIEMRYGLGGQRPRTLREVGEEFGLTAQRVAQIEQRALQKLRDAMEEENPSAS